MISNNLSSRSSSGSSFVSSSARQQQQQQQNHNPPTLSHRPSMTASLIARVAPTSASSPALRSIDGGVWSSSSSSMTRPSFASHNIGSQAPNQESSSRSASISSLVPSSYEVPLFFDPTAQRNASTSSASSVAVRNSVSTARPASPDSSLSSIRGDFETQSLSSSPSSSPRQDESSTGMMATSGDWTEGLEGLKEHDLDDEEENLDVTSVERELNKRTKELSTMAKKSVDDLRAMVMASHAEEPLPPLPQVLPAAATDGTEKMMPMSGEKEASSGGNNHVIGKFGSAPVVRRAKKRPTRLQLAETNYDDAPNRNSPATSLPVSVSFGSQLTLQAGSRASPHSSVHTRTAMSSSPRVHSPLTPSKPDSPARRHLYAKADEIFSKSYSVSPTNPYAQLHSPTNVMIPPAVNPLARERDWSDEADELQRSQSRFSDGTEESHNSTPPFCDDSVSSRASSLHRPKAQQVLQQAHQPQQQQQQQQSSISSAKPVPQNPLLAGLDDYYSPYTARRTPVSPRTAIIQAGRPSTSDAAVHLNNASSSSSPPQSPSGVRFVRHNHSTSDQEALRRFVEEEDEPLRHRRTHQLQNEGSSSPFGAFAGVTTSSSSVQGGNWSSDRLDPRQNENAGSLGSVSSNGKDRKSFSLGSRLRAVSTPKLRQTSSGWRLFGAGSPPAEVPPPLAAPESRPASSSTNHSGAPALSSPTVATRPGSSATRNYPPQAPSGRFRSRTIGEVDDVRRRSGGSNKSSTHNNTGGSSSHGGDDEAGSQPPPRPRRPSSTEAIAAVARRLRRPSKAETYSSSVNSSVNSFLNPSQSSSQIATAFTSPASTTITSAPASTSVFSMTTTTATSKTAKAGPPKSPASRPKSSKGGWASHLNDGLTLHIDHGGQRSYIKLAYLAYEPFTRPEMLCPAVLDERPLTPKRPKSRGADAASTSPYNSPEELGALEYGPADGAAPISLVRNCDEVVIKHLTLGDGTKGDLLTRQATLSTRVDGTHEVSGCERKGKLAWRCVYSVDRMTMRILNFYCSGELVDSNRAKKSKLISGIRKQMAPNLQSLQIVGLSPAASSAPPLAESPTSAVHPSGGVPSLRAGASSTKSISTWSPASMASRQLDASPQSVPGNLPPGVVAFKMSSSTTRSQPRPHAAPPSSASSGAASPVTPGNNLPSPLSSHFAFLQQQHQQQQHQQQQHQQQQPLHSPLTPNDGADDERLQPLSGFRRRGHSFGEAAMGLTVPNLSRPGQSGAGALGLDVSSAPATGPPMAAGKGPMPHLSRYQFDQQQQQRPRHRIIPQTADGTYEYGRRIRASTSAETGTSPMRSPSALRQVSSPSRPPTASEEIKMAYLGTAAAFREMGLDDGTLIVDEDRVVEPRRMLTRPITADVFVRDEGEGRRDVVQGRPGASPTASPHRANVEVHSGLLKGTAKPLPPAPPSLLVDDRPRTTSSLAPSQRFGQPSASPELTRWL